MISLIATVCAQALHSYLWPAVLRLNFGIHVLQYNLYIAQQIATL